MTTPQQQIPTPPQPEESDGAWDEAEYTAYPELPNNPHNHVYTWSPKLADGSMLVIRSNSAAGLVAATEAISGVTNRLTELWGTVRGAAPMPAQPQYPQATQQPNQPYQGQPSWQQAGALQQQNGGYQPNPVPQGWFKLNVPFPQKGAFDAIVQQNGFRKGDPNNGGQLSWQKERKSWYCAPEVAGAFQQFSPVPA